MQNLDERTYDLLFDIRRSVRYHTHRRRFYEGWNMLTVALSVLGGSSAAALALGGPGVRWAVAAAAFVAPVGTLDLVIGTARRANQHTHLAQQFITPEQQFAHGRNLSDEEHEELVRKRLAIEAGEPPVLRLPDMLCYLEVLRSPGDQGERHRIPSWRRVAAHFFSQLQYVRELNPQPGS